MTTCETCASGRRLWFDINCLRCIARHYVLVLTERERRRESRRMREEWSEEKIAEFQGYVEEERGNRVVGAVAGAVASA